jgi:hypothetical protein
MSEHGMDEHDPRVSRAYREEAHPEPGKALDASILAAAREAVSQPKPRRGRWRRFAVPVSAVVVGVVATTLALLMEQETQRVPDLQERAPQPAPVQGKAPPQSADAELSAVDATKAGKRETAPVLAPAPQTAPVPEPTRPEAPTAASATPPVPAESAGRVGPEVSARERSAGSVAPAGEAEGGGISVRSLGKAGAESPEEMVERIRMLQREGRKAEARALLDELRRRYPDFPLPEDLR